MPTENGSELRASNLEAECARVTPERDEAVQRMGAAAQTEDWHELRAALAASEAAVARLRAQVASLSSGIAIRGWWCLPCDSFNGEEHSLRTECRSCGRAKAAWAR